jgi:hypothetical protein
MKLGDVVTGERVLVLPIVVSHAGPGPARARQSRLEDGKEGRGCFLAATANGFVRVLLDSGLEVEVDDERLRVMRGHSPRKVER